MNLQKLTVLIAALAMALPLSLGFSMSEAHAVGGVIQSSRSGGKRVHKRAGAKKSSKSKKRKKTTRSRSTASRRTTRSTAGRTTSSRRVVRNGSSRTRVVRTTRRAPAYRTSHNRRVYTTSRRRSTRHVHTRSSSRTVHHHHHSGHTTTTTTKSQPQKSGGSGIDIFVTGGLGTSGLAVNAIADDSLPGIGWNVGVGGKGEYLGLEIGLDGGGYSLDPDVGGTDIAYLGLYADLKLQPTFSIFEPFAYLGLGAYSLQDGVLNEATGGAGWRAGFGANLRFDDFAVGGKYAYTGMAFSDEEALYGGDFSAQAETVSINLTIYF